jgi:hypothetical protein
VLEDGGSHRGWTDEMIGESTLGLPNATNPPTTTP